MKYCTTYSKGSMIGKPTSQIFLHYNRWHPSIMGVKEKKKNNASPGYLRGKKEHNTERK